MPVVREQQPWLPLCRTRVILSIVEIWGISDEEICQSAQMCNFTGIHSSLFFQHGAPRRKESSQPSLLGD